MKKKKKRLFTLLMKHYGFCNYSHCASVILHDNCDLWFIWKELKILRQAASSAKVLISFIKACVALKHFSDQLCKTYCVQEFIPAAHEGLGCRTHSCC